MSNKQEVTHPNHWLRDEIPLRAVVWHDAVEEILIVSEAARQMCTPWGSRHARDVKTDAVPTQSQSDGGNEWPNLDKCYILI